jgi:short subunit dehydrogenase-like uncharacterized protein
VNDNRPLAVLGATGYTGRLVVEQARALGIPVRLVGRRREALEALAQDGDDVRVADAAHEQELIDAFDGAFAVASTAGPFAEIGTKPVGAAIAVGAHYPRRQRGAGVRTCRVRRLRRVGRRARRRVADLVRVRLRPR